MLKLTLLYCVSHKSKQNCWNSKDQAQWLDFFLTRFCVPFKGLSSPSRIDVSLLHSKKGLLLSNSVKYFCWKRGLKKENNSVNVSIIFCFGNSTADRELDVREVSKCLSAFGTELPVGVKGNAMCRNLTFFSPLLNGSGLGKAYRCTCVSAVSSRGYSAGKECEFPQLQS